jgi:dTDP-4-dehydrorhamnose 3,5-epimerase-like enzyme
MKIKYFEYDIMSDEECECGSLIALEECKNIPFEIKRVFYIYGVDTSVSRGAHAHKASNQVLIAVNGSCEIVFDDAKERQKILLDSPNKGILQENMIWGEMQHFSQDCVLMVLSDSFYHADDYIRDYDDFLKLCKVD